MAAAHVLVVWMKSLMHLVVYDLLRHLPTEKHVIDTIGKDTKLCQRKQRLIRNYQNKKLNERLAKKRMETSEWKIESRLNCMSTL